MYSTFLNVQRFGTRGNGRSNDTFAIQQAIDSAWKQGGGTVVVPSGTYLIGAVQLRSNITLYLETGSVLLGSRNRVDYPCIDSRWEGKTQEVHAPLIGGTGLENVAIVGRGMIDGQGDAFWDAFRKKELEYPRPRCISFLRCRNVHIEGITIRNSPSWTIHPILCEGVTIQRLTILNPPESPNTDGINPDSCRAVRISDCYISVGDDCITLKAGTEDEESALLYPCEDVTISNCILERGHGGIVLGSEMTGGIRNVVVSNCIFKGTDRGIRLKTRRGRGGVVESIRVSNCVMEGVLSPFTVNMFYGCGAWGDSRVACKTPLPVSEDTPTIRSLHLSGITARKVKLAAAFMLGLPESPIRDVRLIDWEVELDTGEVGEGEIEMAEGLPNLVRSGVYVKHARDFHTSNVIIKNAKDVPFHFEDVEGKELYQIPATL